MTAFPRLSLISRQWSRVAMRSFEGRVVAKLPFVPLPLLQGISHRGLLGDDYTDCSFIFLYIVATIPIRQARGCVALSTGAGDEALGFYVSD